ncbi:MAG: hypothetical protein ACOYN0_03790 [Phycisphaerales bacterium]
MLRSFGMASSAFALLLPGVAWAQPVTLLSDAVIGPTDTSIIDPGSGASVPLSTAQITVRGCVLTVNGRHAIASLNLVRDESNEAAVLTHGVGAFFDYGAGTGGDVVYGTELLITGALSIEGASGSLVGSRIDASGRGFAGGNGPGAGPSGTQITAAAPGGGHGGRGAKVGAVAGGISYGDLLSPRTFGSGGGSSGTRIGGAGGGAVRLVVNGVMTLDGRIVCDGRPGEGVAGSGAGGSISINAASLVGSGSISASGADGAAGWGGGAGGRVALITGTSTFSGVVTANGGASVFSIERGGAGTIFLKGASATLGDLVMRSGGDGSVPAAVTTVPKLESLRSLTISGGANAFLPNLVSLQTPLTVEGASIASLPALTTAPGGLTVRAVSRLIVGSMRDINGPVRIEGASILQVAPGVTTVRGDLVLAGPANQLVLPTSALCVLNVLGAVTVDARSTIFGNGLGFAPGEGPGAGTSGPQRGSGAGHGGVGAAAGSAPGGLAYGSGSKPRFPGSGGGSKGQTRGGGGGAALRLDATGPVTVNGSISCSGQSAPVVNAGAGAGSGGSLVIRTPSLSGSGLLLADGGGATTPGGAGGGGRVAVFTCNRSLATGNIRALRGTGDGSGTAGAGSVYFGSGAIRVTQQPGNVNARSGSAVTMEVSAENAGGITSYRWRRMDSSGEYQPLIDGGRVSGAGTRVLAISEADCSDTGVYDCLLTDSCGGYPSNDGLLVVTALADFDGHVGVDGDDIIAFFAAWDSVSETSDVNADGSVDSDDVILFLTRWDLGC